MNNALLQGCSVARSQPLYPDLFNVRVWPHGALLKRTTVRWSLTTLGFLQVANHLLLDETMRMRMRLDSTGKAKIAPLIERDSRCVVGCHPGSELTVAALLRPSGYSVDQPYSKSAPSLGGDNEHGNKEWHGTRASELVC